VNSDLKHVYRVNIQAAPEKVWQALTNSEYTAKFWYGSAISSDWKAGSEYKLTTPDGSNVFIHGKVLEADPPRRLVQTYKTNWPPFDTEKETTMTWELEPVGDGTKLTLTHEGFQEGSRLYEQLGTPAGWAHVVNGLKSVVETGQPAAAPAGS
jgi:uncharacterized protein YndB with AHSA1/START domain